MKRLAGCLLTLFLIGTFVFANGEWPIIWDFENGNTHGFEFFSRYPAITPPSEDDPTTAGDERLTGGWDTENDGNLPQAGIAWTVGSLLSFNGLKPGADPDHARVDDNGLLQFILSKPRIGWITEGSLNTFLLNMHGDYVHSETNDQVARSPVVELPAEGPIILSVISSGGGGDIAPELDDNTAELYKTESSGIAVWVIDGTDTTFARSLHLHNKGSLGLDTLDLSAYAGKKIFIEVVDAFQGGWGWLAVQHIQIGSEVMEMPELKSGKTALICKDATIPDELSSGDSVLYIWIGKQGYTGIETPGGQYPDIIPSSSLSDPDVIEDLKKYDFIIISESIGSGDVKYIKDIPVPTVCLEGWAAKPGVFDFMVDKVVANIDVKPVKIVDNSGHPLAAGFNEGDMVSLAGSGLIVGSIPQIPVIPIAEAGEDTLVIYGVEQGTRNANDISMKHRIAVIGIHELAYTSMTDTAYKFIDAAIDWVRESFKVGIVAHWPMDEGSGNIINDKVNGIDGKLIGLNTSECWLPDGGVRFDNIDGHHILVPHKDTLDFDDRSFTISMFVRYVTRPTDTDRWLVKGTHDGSIFTGKRYELFHTSGPTVRFTIDDNVTKTKLEVPDDAFVTGDWVHVVAIRDAVYDSLMIFADGAFIGGCKDETGDISNGEPLCIGESTDESETAMSGDIKDIRLYNYVLTPDEIAEIGSKLGMAKIAHWKLDETSGTTAEEIVNGLDGTLEGFEGDEWVTIFSGGGLDFSAASDTALIRVPDNSLIRLSEESFSVAYLIKTDITQNQTIFYKGTFAFAPHSEDSCARWLQSEIKNGELRFAIDDNGNQDTVKFSDTDTTGKTQLEYDLPEDLNDQWMHVVCVRDRIQDSLFIYINGEKVASIWDKTEGPIGTEHDLILGNYYKGTNKFKGILADFRIYGRALSDEEVKGMYIAGPEVAIHDVAEAGPKEFKLMQNYPNPFNPSTNIKFQLPTDCYVTLSIYNILGQRVETLVNKYMNKGYHQVRFDAKNLPSGVYFYRIKAGKYTEIKKMMLLK
ncbi:MAG: T9SS type A sorting domain-containing protein [Candidatus Marinimicrobia bacterium]|nr:T9SS type A sorting domain-containing protein [Candidatus Neomarinimicrobiota bacterium]